MENDIQATLSQMRKEFIVRLPERLDILKALLTNIECGQRDSIETLHRAAHSLVGAAGVHRLMLISEAARNLEQIVAAIPADPVLYLTGTLTGGAGGVFSLSAPTTLGEVGDSDVQIADVDKDGHLDAVVGAFKGSGLTLLRNDPTAPGTFEVISLPFDVELVRC
jgi:hypothetical protein